MYIEELNEMSYREFINAVATARSKRDMKVRLTQAEHYLLEHQTSIEITILQREEDINWGVPTGARSLSDDLSDPEFVSAKWADFGVNCDQLPSKALKLA